MSAKRREGVVARRGEASFDQERAKLVAVEPDGVGLVVEARPPDVHRGGVVDETFRLGVAVEADDRGEATSDRGARLAGGLQHAGEGLDVGAVDLQDRKVVGRAEQEELAEVARVGVTRESAVAAEEPGNRQQDRFMERVAGEDEGGWRSGHDGLRGLVAGVGVTPAREVILNRQPQRGRRSLCHPRGRSALPPRSDCR